MPDYGVPDDLDGLLPWEWAEERLLKSRNFWLITVRPDGRPHALPVWGVWMPDRQRWGCGFAASSQKSRNLQANAEVVVTGEDTVEVVSIEGTAQSIEGDAAHAFIEAWVDKYAEEIEVVDDASREQARDFLRSSAMIEVIPRRAIGMIEHPDQFSTAATRWVWESAG
ncbi:MAG: pyridoxamine 5'-phosphate oxidase family protein [Actinomycetota bacterium]